MNQLIEYRERLVNRLEEATREFRAACLAVAKPDESVGADGWSVRQIVVHVRDVDGLVYGERVRRTLSEDSPAFLNFDGDAYMREHYEPGEALDSILDQLAASISGLVTTLRKLPPEGWSRESSHEVEGGGLTVQTWVERGLGHIEEHLQTVKTALQRG